MVVRLIQVGLGGWGQSWYRDVVTHTPGVETVAWVEVVEEALVSARKALKLPAERCFTSLEVALKSVEADAVHVTASLNGHIPSTVTALQAGKHVLLEKPFAGNLAEAQEVVELAEQRNLILMISQNYRFMPAIPVVTRLVREQELGAVGMVNIDFRRSANTVPAVGNHHYRLWQPLLVDMSIHHFDLMRAVLGQEPRQISCTTYNPPWSNFVEPPVGYATILFDGGSVVNYRGSWISGAPQTNWGGEWSMECEKGTIEWTSRGVLPDQVTLRPLGKDAVALALPAMTTTDRQGSLSAFVQAVNTSIQPATSGRDNLNTLALMFAAIESASANGKLVDILQL